jgi:ubiquinone/menaquinone biosynthesis C-methylase UbiE
MSSTFIREDLTVKFLNDNNMPVNKPLPVFIQDYLSTRYVFTPKTEKLNVSHIYDIRQFAIYMFQCNTLLNVECLEFDHTCFALSTVNEFDMIQYVIPQPDGFDYVIRSSQYLDFVFINTPFFMLNNIVHPVSYDTKTLYLLGLYETFKSPTFNKSLMPFSEGIYDFFNECYKKQLPFKDIVSKIILSQLPSFNDYFEAVLPILLNNINIVDTYPSLLKLPNVEIISESKSSVLVSTLQKGRYVSEYDEKLLNKYKQNLDKLLPFETKIYSYPISTPMDKKIVYYANSAITYEIYLKLINEIGEYENDLERIYKMKKSLSMYLKPYYFTYHMRQSTYNNIYSYPQPAPFREQYYPTWTLNQINSIINKEDLFRLIIKTVWYNDKYIASRLDKDLKNLVNDTRLNDIQIYNKINELYKRNKPKETGFDRGQFRYNELNKLGLLNNLEKNDYTTYLDFGGGIGDVSSSIAKNLKLKKENSFVTDIQNWLGKEHTDEYVKYITYRYLKTNYLPFEEGTFNLITCLQVLHHIPDKKYTISELRRVINSNGILIVREHDCRNDQDRTLIDIEHSLHAYAVDEQGIDYFQNYHDKYMSKEELAYLMNEGGFDLVKTFPEKGLTRYYYSVWKPSGKGDGPLVSKATRSWADDVSSDEEDVDLNIDKNKQPNLTFKKLSEYDKDDVADEMKDIEFPYHKYYINNPDYYFNNLKNFKYTLNPEIVDRIQGIYFKSPITYIFKEPELFGMNRKQMTPTLLTMKEDYSTIDVITNLFTEEQRIKAKVYKGKSDAISPFEFWMTRKSKIIEHIYEQKQPLNSYTLREAIFTLVPEATLFKTTVAKSIYDIFKPKHILDMSSGWGDRMIAAIAYGEASGVDVKYSGFDPNSSLKYQYLGISTLAPENKRGNFKVRTEPFETANLKDIKDVDLFFSSPPYFDFEVYTNEETQSINNYKTYPDWIVKFLFKSIKNAFSVIVKDGYFVMHITDTGNMRNVCELIKLYIEEHLEGSYIGCIFTQAPGRRRHPMWVFKKDPGSFKQNKKKDKNISNLYPEIYNLIITPTVLDSVIGTRTVKSSSSQELVQKKERPYDDVGFNF